MLLPLLLLWFRFFVAQLKTTVIGICCKKLEQKFVIKAIKGQIKISNEDFKVDVSSISPLSEGI